MHKTFEGRMLARTLRTSTRILVKLLDAWHRSHRDQLHDCRLHRVDAGLDQVYENATYLLHGNPGHICLDANGRAQVSRQRPPSD